MLLEFYLNVISVLKRNRLVFIKTSLCFFNVKKMFRIRILTKNYNFGLSYMNLLLRFECLGNAQL